MKRVIWSFRGIGITPTSTKPKHRGAADGKLQRAGARSIYRRLFLRKAQAGRAGEMRSLEPVLSLPLLDLIDHIREALLAITFVNPLIVLEMTQDIY